ncbi:hypothetical protein HanPSC8_Chr08g0341201 [Helianthus annuus]|nr:hypothetical protein HanPSC8_Chr08g0341201 [Helianthus annuus]
MALSSLTSFINESYQYDVFLSFRCETHARTLWITFIMLSVLTLSRTMRDSKKGKKTSMTNF